MQKCYRGVVIRGESAGTKLGFPTANIALEDVNISGTYVGTVVVDDILYEAGIYANQRRNILETHILDFSGDLYGKTITVTLHEKIRDDKVFTNEKDLSKTIASDIKKVREYFDKP